MRNIILGIRTVRVDYQVQCIYSYYMSQGVDVVLVVDETKERMETGYMKKVSVDKEFLNRNMLFQKINNVGWLCGDYFLYALYEKYKEKDGFWLIEDDALIFSESLLEWLRLPIEKGIDFSANYFGTAPDNWPWKKPAQIEFNKEIIKKCSFGIVCASKEFVRKSLEKRIDYSRKFSVNGNNSFLNDESFIMNAMDTGQFRFLSMNSIYGESFFKNYKFTTSGKNFYINNLFNRIESGFYHPVLVVGDHFDFFDRNQYIFNRVKKNFSGVFSLIKNRINNRLRKIEERNNKKFAVIVVSNDENLLMKSEQSIKMRWIDCFPLKTDKNIEINDDFFEVLRRCTSELSGYSYYWVLNADFEINLSKNRSLVKELELIAGDDESLYFYKMNKTILGLKISRENMFDTANCINSPLLSSIPVSLEEIFKFEDSHE